MAQQREAQIANMNDIRRWCPRCKKEFIITVKEQIFFKGKKWDLMKACKLCSRKPVEVTAKNPEKRAKQEAHQWFDQ